MIVKNIVCGVLMVVLCACSDVEHLEIGEGTLRVHVQVDPQVFIAVKSTDIASYSLEVSQEGTVVKKVSPIGDNMDPISLKAGSYVVRAYSQDFTAPAFDTPVYEGSVPVTIATGNETAVAITCAQSNAGVQIQFTDTFLANHESYFVTVSQIEGTLTFTVDDVVSGRIGYFLPGEAVITVTADGVEYEEEVELEACRVYNVSVDDAPPVVSGDLKADITIDTDVLTEEVAVIFPSGVVDYSETMGGIMVSSQTVVAGYTGWANKQVVYSGLNSYIAAESNFSDTYSGASGGNYLLFRQAESWFSVSGINTSTAATDMILTFGCCAESVCDLNTSLMVSVSQNGTDFTQLLTTDQQINSRWKSVSFSEGIPRAENLTIRIENRTSIRCMIDDLSLKTL
ncbi:MAG TPA: DUF4493 domain-containing protein [Candidatus Alistipes merdigallinarum]|nr:DUF4493 domain-containing protein [Candidatus Alistipes merdigallinarum]